MIEYVCLIVKTYIFGPVFEQTLAINLSGCVFEMSRNLMMILFSHFFARITFLLRVSVQGVESLWYDCRFIPADWGS